jgi:PhnB protein
MSQLYPYLRFNDGKCKEAMSFYKNCFGGTVTLQTFGDSPMGKDTSEGKDKIMNASLEKNGNVLFMASDMMRDKAIVGDNVAVTFNGDSEEEIRTIFAKLSESGEVFMPLEMQFWGGLFGVVTDKYKIEWMLNFQKEPMKK